MTPSRQLLRVGFKASVVKITKCREVRVVTIKEIAEMIGVSSATVSRVLNEDPTISVGNEKRKLILETAESLNYKTPRRRTGKKLGTIGILHYLDPSDELRDPYYVGLRLGIENRCNELQIDAVTLHKNMHDNRNKALKTAKGVIVIAAEPTDSKTLLNSFGHNVVFADCVPPSKKFDSVQVDLYGATKEVLDGLKNSGSERIAFVGQSKEINSDKREESRFAAYRDWMVENSLYDESLTAISNHNDGRQWEKMGFSLTVQLLESGAHPDAIVAFNDSVALGVYRALDGFGLSVPDEVSVVGFNDVTVAQFLTPPLTTVKIPVETIGETAVDLLVERIQGRSVAKRVQMETQAIWRKSATDR